MKNIVYKITNNTTGEFYFGSTEHPDIRLKEHFDLLERSCKQNNKLHSDILKLSKESFSVDVIFETEDKVEASRIESSLIRKNILKDMCYNIACGASGRRVFYDSEIIFIRELYGRCEMIGSEVYNKHFKDKVTERAFSKVWKGETFKDIHYHVYSNENKSWHASRSRSLTGEKNGMSIITENDVVYIRQQRKNGVSRFVVYEEYKDKLTQGSFECVWYYNNWKHVKV